MDAGQVKRAKRLSAYHEQRLNPATSKASLKSSGSGRPTSSSIDEPIYEDVGLPSEQRERDSYVQGRSAPLEISGPAALSQRALLPSTASRSNTKSPPLTVKKQRPHSVDFTSTGSFSSLRNQHNAVGTQKSNRLSTSADSVTTQSDKVIGSLRENINNFTDATRKLAQLTKEISEAGGDSDSNLNLLIRSNAVIADTSQNTMYMYQELMHELRTMAANTDQLLKENRELAETNARIMQDRSDKTHQLLDSVHRHITGLGPSDEELQIEAMNPLIMPKEKVDIKELDAYGYNKARLFISPCLGKPGSIEALQCIFPNTDNIVPTLLKTETLAEFLDDTATALKNIRELSEINVYVLWQDNAGTARLPADRVLPPPIMPLYNLAGARLPRPEKQNKKEGTLPPQVSLPMALFLLSLTRGDFKNAGLLLAMEPKGIGVSLIERATPGHIFPVEVIFWMLHGLCRRKRGETKRSGEAQDIPTGIGVNERISALKLVGHLFAFPNVDTTGKIASKISSRSTSELRAGWGATAHHDRDYFEDILSAILRPPLDGSGSEMIKSYAFVLAIVEKAIMNFIDDLASNEQNTRQRVETSIGAVIAAFGIITNVAGLFPGASLAANATQIALEVAAKAASADSISVLEKSKKLLKKVGHQKEEKKETHHKNLFDEQQINDLRDDVQNILQAHIQSEYEDYNLIISLIKKMKGPDKEKAARNLSDYLKARYSEEKKLLGQLAGAHLT